MNLQKALMRCYDEEINVSVTSFFDEGWTVKIGDPINGFTDEAGFDRITDATDWIRERVMARKGVKL